MWELIRGQHLKPAFKTDLEESQPYVNSVAGIQFKAVKELLSGHCGKEKPAGDCQNCRLKCIMNINHATMNI